MEVLKRVLAGTLGGFVGGSLIGLGEAAVISAVSAPSEYWVFLFGSVSYGLIGAGILHVMSAYSLTRLNMASNKPYQSKQDFIAANFASRTMRVSGIVVGAYIIFHLADLTWGVIPGYEWERGHVYENLVGSLSNPIVALVYIVANILLAAHLYHGLWSMFQTLGLSNPRWNSLRRVAASGLSLIILIGNVSFPIAILSGIVDVN